MTRSFAEIERIVERYDTATAELDQAVSGRIADSLDASYRNLERELRRLYPTWQSDGSLYAVQRRLLLMEQLGETLAIVRPEMRAEYEALFTEALTISHESGARMADELVRARDPGYPLQEFTTVPIEAAVAQARDGVGRLYRYNDEFKTAVSGVVEQGLLQGWGADKVARMLRGNEQMQGQFGVAQLKSKAETIARTEIMSAFGTATQQRIAENGLLVQVMNTPSERLCSFCLGRHGNVYEVGQISVPFHPRCRDVLLPYSKKWAERGWTDDAAIAADKTERIEEMAKLGTKPNYGPTHWEKRAGLTEAPQAVWKPGDAAPVAPKPKPEPKPKKEKAKKATPQPAPTGAAVGATPQPAPAAAAESAPAYTLPKASEISKMEQLGRGSKARVALDRAANVAIKQQLYDKLNQEEIDISRRAGELGVGPLVRAVDPKKMAMAIDYLPNHKTFENPATLRQLPPEIKKQVAINLVRQIQTLHKNGITHNDFHYNNAMYDPSTGAVKIIDYGTAEAKPGQIKGRDVAVDVDFLRRWFADHAKVPGLKKPSVTRLFDAAAKRNELPDYDQIIAELDRLL